MTKEQKAATFILVGLAAFALYRLSRLNAKDRSILADKIKTKGKELYDQVKPVLFKNTSVGKNMMEAGNV